MPAEVGLAGPLRTPVTIREAAVTRFSAVRDQVEQADGLPAVLDAACEAFHEMLPVIRAHEDPGSGWFTAFVMAGTCAANGRDAILFAPSLPPKRLHPLPADTTAPGQGSVGTIAGVVASLSGLLAARLAQAAASTPDPRDREACQRAAGYARDLQSLLTGSGP